MLAATFIGILFIPSLFVLFQSMREHFQRRNDGGFRSPGQRQARRQWTRNYAARTANLNVAASFPPID
jgi:hypothetical protein